jgi:hypothetical protein
MEVLKPVKVQINNLFMKLINASAEEKQISDKYIKKLDKDVKEVASMFDPYLKEMF